MVQATTVIREWLIHKEVENSVLQWEKLNGDLVVNPIKVSEQWHGEWGGLAITHKCN